MTQACFLQMKINFQCKAASLYSTLQLQEKLGSSCEPGTHERLQLGVAILDLLCYVTYDGSGVIQGCSEEESICNLLHNLNKILC